VRPTVYIPNFNGVDRIGRALRSLREQSREVAVVVVDNGSRDGSAELIRAEHPEVELLELARNHGFGAALNRAVAAHPGDPVILLNNDAEAEPRFVEALLDGLGERVDSVAGVLLQEAAPRLIDSAGLVADTTLMAFDHLHGEPVEAALSAPDPLGPCGGAALYRRAAFEALGGFDERIFLYGEDLDLALRMAAAGGRCRLAPEARALHAFSATLGGTSGAKFSHSGWSRGYLLRRYGVMSRPRGALGALARETAICGGQLLMYRTGRGIAGRLRGWRAAAGLERRGIGEAPLAEIGTREALALRRGRRR
jgi:GT2 family glycosyltransferase